MLNILTGRSGYGKTDEIIRRISRVLLKGRRVFVIVPEQQSVVMEKKLLETLGNSSNMLCEVLNFERLPERVFREIGGVKEKYIDRSGRLLLMKGILEELSPGLLQYKNTYLSSDYVVKMLDETEALKRQAISAESLHSLSGQTADKKQLSEKLEDLSVIMSAYTKCFTELKDPIDNISRLIEADGFGEFFKETELFIDGYYTFTGCELKLLEALMYTAVNVHITICEDNEDYFINQTKERMRLCRLAEKNAVPFDIVSLSSNTRTAGELAVLEKNIWRLRAHRSVSEDKIRIYECEDMFSEATAAAAEVLRLVKLGYRFKDIGVAVRRSDLYAGIADAVFKKYGINCFMSVKEELSTRSAASILMAAAELAASDFSLRSVKKYIKSPYSGLTPDECDALDRYISMWDIHGGARYKKEWKKSPRGYVKAESPADIQLLKLINNARLKFADSVSALITTLNSKKLTYKSAAEALYNHLTAIQADELLYNEAQLCRDSGDEDECTKLTTVWDSIIKMLEQLWLVGSDRETDAKGVYSALSLMIKEYQTGQIPTSADEVQIGDAAFMRFDNIKALLVLGVNDGVFPSAPAAGGLFSESELGILIKHGYEAGMTGGERLMMEQFIFYRTVAAPSERLSVFYPLTGTSSEAMRPSAAVGRIRQLFPNIKIHKPEQEPELLIANRALAVEYSAMLSPEQRELLGVKAAENKSAALKPHPDMELRISPSGIERYSLCPFSYYATDMLRLKEAKKAVFEPADAGVFVHAVLEEFLRRYGKSINEISDSEAESFVDAQVKEYLDSLGDEALPKRLAVTVERIGAMCVEVIKNIRGELKNSLFSVAELECKIESNENGLVLNGIIDRIDTFEKDGKLYVKVVDYKTGNKKLCLNDVLGGLSLQMLIYLFSYCSKDKNRIPAAVLYMPAKMPSGDSPEKIEKSLKRSGFVLAEKDITSALELDESGVYMPVVVTASGNYHKSKSSVVSSTGFELINRFIDSYISETADKIKSGEIPVSPLVKGNKACCTYCKMQPLCRRTDDMKRKTVALSEKSAMLAQTISEEVGK